MTIDTEGRYRHAQGLSWRRVGDETVIIDLGSGAYFALNEVGSFVWERLGEGRAAAEIAAAIPERWATEAAQAERHVDELIGRLLASKLLVPA